MAAERDAVKVRSMMERIANVAKVLYSVFAGLFIVYAVCVVAVFVVSLAFNANETPAGLLALQALPHALSAIGGGAIIYLFCRIFRNVSKSMSPFTMHHARLLKIIGFLLLACAVAESVASVMPELLGVVGDVSMGFQTPLGTHPESALFISGKMLFSSIVCFCLSYVFKYGALLQWLTDETA